jgi:hypothetical protein
LTAARVTTQQQQQQQDSSSLLPALLPPLLLMMQPRLLSLPRAAATVGRMLCLFQGIVG